MLVDFSASAPQSWLESVPLKAGYAALKANPEWRTSIVEWMQTQNGLAKDNPCLAGRLCVLLFDWAPKHDRITYGNYSNMLASSYNLNDTFNQLLGCRNTSDLSKTLQGILATQRTEKMIAQIPELEEAAKNGTLKYIISAKNKPEYWTDMVKLLIRQRNIPLLESLAASGVPIDGRVLHWNTKWNPQIDNASLIFLCRNMTKESLHFFLKDTPFLSERFNAREGKDYVALVMLESLRADTIDTLIKKRSVCDPFFSRFEEKDLQEAKNLLRGLLALSKEGKISQGQLDALLKGGMPKCGAAMFKSCCLEQDLELLEVVNHSSNTPIHYGVLGGIKVLTCVVSKHNKYSFKDVLGGQSSYPEMKTPLHLAVERNDIDCARYLLETFSQAYLKEMTDLDSTARTALHYCKPENTEMKALLLEFYEPKLVEYVNKTGWIAKFLDNMPLMGGQKAEVNISKLDTLDSGRLIPLKIQARIAFSGCDTMRFGGFNEHVRFGVLGYRVLTIDIIRSSREAPPTVPVMQGASGTMMSPIPKEQIPHGLQDIITVVQEAFHMKPKKLAVQESVVVLNLPFEITDVVFNEITV